MEKIVEIKDYEADGCYDDELLAECMSVLEYATYHDGRYGQDQNWEKFQSPAQKLVMRLAKRLGRKPYDGFGGQHLKLSGPAPLT